MTGFVEKEVDLVRSSGLFDEKWYLKKYPDVVALGIDPVEHYLRFGARLKRNPSPEFDTAAYLEDHPDVAKNGTNPLVHFVRHGRAEGRVARAASDLNGKANVAQQDWGAVVRRIESSGRRCAVVVPVYNAPEETEACIKTLLANTPAYVQIILINDASPDERVQRLLSHFAGISNIRVVSNSSNLGFTRTVNRGIELAGDADVILLNSDTKVTPLWFQNLRLAAYSGDKVATVTPFSDNAGAFSAPEIGRKNDMPRGLSLDENARLTTRAAGRFYPTVPTGNGFCMYVRRDAIDVVGALDAEAFPRGYGEENDFCMRAARAGFSHVIDDATLIHHVRSASFGEEKTPLMKAGRAVIDQRYPEYTSLVRRFVDNPDIAAMRRRIRAAWDRPVPAAGPRPRALFVVSTRTGGTPQTNADLMAALEDRWEPYLLRCNSREIELSIVSGREVRKLETVKLREPLKGFPHVSAEYDATVAGMLVRHAIELVHVRHIAWHGLGLPRIAKALGLPVVFSFHDFYTICPTVKLLDENSVVCGGKCTATPGECRHELWTEPDFPPLKNAAIRGWQKAMADMLDWCDAFVTTADSARQQIESVFPATRKKPFVIIPHGRDFSMTDLAAPFDPATKPFRILVAGNIDEPKGSRIIEAVAQMDGGRRFEFHLLGATRIEARPGIVVHGRYDRDEFDEKVADIRPHAGAVLSIWPETFCHTLTEMWACCLPVIALDRGAVGERIAAHGGGWLIADSDPGAVSKALEAIVADPEGIAARRAEVKAWQGGIGAVHTTLYMSHAYDRLYRGQVSQRAGTVADRLRVALLVPDRGAASAAIRVIEKTRDRPDRALRYDLLDLEAARQGALGGYSTVLVQRTALPPEAVDTFLDSSRAAGRKIVYEIDDDLTRFEGRLDSSIDYARLGESVVKLLVGADLVVVSTEELAHRFRHFNRHIVVSPNALAERLWFGGVAPALARKERPRKVAGDFHMLYMGTRTHDADLAILKEAMARLHKDGAKISLFTVGITQQKADWYETIAVPDPFKPYASFVPWLRSLAVDMDLAVAPLEDTIFNRGKSALKHYEYAAIGLCGLYSDVEPYRSVVRHGETGLLVPNTADAWSEAIALAAADADLRNAIAARAREEVALPRGMRAEADRLDEAILGLLGVTPRMGPIPLHSQGQDFTGRTKTQVGV